MFFTFKLKRAFGKLLFFVIYFYGGMMSLYMVVAILFRNLLISRTLELST